MKQIIIEEYPHARIKENYKEYEFINQFNEAYKKVKDKQEADIN